MTHREFLDEEHLINAYTWGRIQKLLFEDLDQRYKEGKDE